MIVKDYFGNDINVAAYVAKYHNGNLAIRLVTYDDEPWALLTVNLGDKLPEDHAYVDINNCPWAREFIEKYELGEWTGGMGHSGFCVYPLYRFDLTKLGEKL